MTTKAAYFWWEVVALLQRTILTGWLLLVNVDLHFIRIVAALIVSLLFLIALLLCDPYVRKFDFGMAVGSQLLLVCSQP